MIRGIANLNTANDLGVMENDSHIIGGDIAVFVSLDMTVLARCRRICENRCICRTRCICEVCCIGIRYGRS